MVGYFAEVRMLLAIAHEKGMLMADPAVDVGNRGSRDGAGTVTVPEPLTPC